MKTDWTSYPSPGFHDELVGPAGGARAAGRALMRYLTEMDGDEIAVRQQAAELAIKAMGITFTVYHEQDGSIDRAWPLDIIPRTISRKEWQKIEAGLIQRAAALNLFIDDVYHEQKFIKDGLMPGLDHRDVEELPRRSAAASNRRSASGRTSAAPTWSATRTARSTCSRTTCACPRACPTCSRTARW